MFHFFKAIFDTSFKPFGKWNYFVQMVNAIRGRNSLVVNFAYHLPRPWTDRFAHVDGNQPRKGRKCLFFLTWPFPISQGLVKWVRLRSVS